MAEAETEESGATGGRGASASEAQTGGIGGPGGLLTYQGVALWRHTQIIQWAVQIVSAVVVVALVAWFFLNIVDAVQDREIHHGLEFLNIVNMVREGEIPDTFLGRAYQTPIGEHFIPYESSDSFRYALIVAASNTVIVSIVGVVFAIALGIAVGVARLSGNWLVSKIAQVYVEFFRNVPLLVQLFFWFYIILALPPVREGYVLGGMLYINNAGVSLPFPQAVGAATGSWIVVAALAVAAGFLAHRLLVGFEARTGRAVYPVWTSVALTLGIGAAGWLIISFAVGESPLYMSVPEPQGRFGRISGGWTIRAGLMVLLVGLVIYTSAFIAEIVRAGIQSVSRGQVEAGRALGLSPMEALRHVIFPQALRVIIPPLISQCLNLTKNSSLGGAVGYTELTNVAITMTQTAPAIAIFLLIMAAYLAMSLSYSLAGNIYNHSIRFTRR